MFSGRQLEVVAGCRIPVLVIENQIDICRGLSNEDRMGQGKADIVEGVEGKGDVSEFPGFRDTYRVQEGGSAEIELGQISFDLVVKRVIVTDEIGISDGENRILNVENSAGVSWYDNIHSSKGCLGTIDFRAPRVSIRAGNEIEGPIIGGRAPVGDVDAAHEVVSGNDLGENQVFFRK